MTAVFSIQDAFLTFANDGSIDNTRYSTELCEILGKPLDSSFKLYVNSITNDVVMWINNFPERFASYQGLTKPKSAMLNLLGNSRVIEACGVEFCESAASMIAAKWQKHNKAIEASRKQAKALAKKVEKIRSPVQDLPKRSTTAIMKENSVQSSGTATPVDLEIDILQETDEPLIEICTVEESDSTTYDHITTRNIVKGHIMFQAIQKASIHALQTKNEELMDQRNKYKDEANQAVFANDALRGTISQLRDEMKSFKLMLISTITDPYT